MPKSAYQKARSRFQASLPAYAFRLAGYERRAKRLQPVDEGPALSKLEMQDCIRSCCARGPRVSYPANAKHRDPAFGDAFELKIVDVASLCCFLSRCRAYCEQQYWRNAHLDVEFRPSERHVQLATI